MLRACNCKHYNPNNLQREKENKVHSSSAVTLLWPITKTIQSIKKNMDPIKSFTDYSKYFDSNTLTVCATLNSLSQIRVVKRMKEPGKSIQQERRLAA